MSAQKTPGRTDGAPTRALLAAMSSLATTERERQILSLKAQGMSYRQVAERLGVTEPAVTRAMRRVRRRNGIRA